MSIHSIYLCVYVWVCLPIRTKKHRCLHFSIWSIPEIYWFKITSPVSFHGRKKTVYVNLDTSKAEKFTQIWNKTMRTKWEHQFALFICILNTLDSLSIRCSPKIQVLEYWTSTGYDEKGREKNTFTIRNK